MEMDTLTTQGRATSKYEYTLCRPLLERIFRWGARLTSAPDLFGDWCECDMAQLLWLLTFDHYPSRPISSGALSGDCLEPWANLAFLRYCWATDHAGRC